VNCLSKSILPHVYAYAFISSSFTIKFYAGTYLRKKAYTSLACLVHASYDSHFLITGYDPRAFIVNILIAILPFQLWFLESSSVHHTVSLWFCTRRLWQLKMVSVLFLFVS
ncbi:unnamed protein product, partial [Ixodes pacificus]